MPTYEYKCLQCGRSFDLSHPIGAEPGPCPVCGGTVRRIYSSIGVIFKGSGFHSTDYRKTTPKDEGARKEDAGASSSAPEKGTAKEPSQGTAKEPSQGTTAKEPSQGSTHEPPKGSSSDAKRS